MRRAPLAKSPYTQEKAPALKVALYAAFGMISIVLAVGITAIAQLRSIRTELVNARREAVSLQERVARLEKQSSSSEGQQQGSQAQSDEKAVPFELTSAETQAVRVYIKVPPSPPGTPPSLNEGDLLPTGALLPLPSQIVDQVPKLKGARFTTDQNGAIILVRRGSRRADVIIPPR